MKKIIAAFVFGVLGGGLVPLGGQEDEGHFVDPDEESGHYAFLGAKLLMNHKGEMFPVSSIHEGRVYLNTDNGIRPAKETSDCMIEAVVGISNLYLHVEDVKIDYSYTKQVYLESALMSEADKMERDAKFAIQTGDLSTSADPNDDDGGGYSGDFEDIDPYSEAGETLRNIDDYQEHVENMVKEGGYETEGVFDTLSVEMQLVSNVDLEEVVCAVVVKYVKDDAYSRFMNERGSSIRIHMLTDLMGDIPNQISFRKVLGTGAYQKDSAEIEFYFFDRDGKPIASNRASGLKMLTWSQLERLQGSES